jgi:PKD repeat protein
VSSSFTFFNVQSSSGYPPQASFAYWPAAPYENQTVNLDASSSTPEGFNDTITRYEWNFGDGTPELVNQGNPPDPTATHTYLNAGPYVITLNVTNTEGLWCTASKPITVYPQFGPKASFTSTPETRAPVNSTITFDATSCTPGWSKQLGGYSPISNYNWNFGDGTIINTANPATTYNYTQPANYTVTLTITDSVGRTDTTSTIIQIYNVTAPPWDVNGDGKVDVTDIFLVAKAYGSSPGEPGWDPRCDVNGDGKVDITDLFIVAKHYGEVYF